MPGDGQIHILCPVVVQKEVHAGNGNSHFVQSLLLWKRSPWSWMSQIYWMRTQIPGRLLLDSSGLFVVHVTRGVGVLAVVCDNVWAE